jgi:hypothetical protein
MLLACWLGAAAPALGFCGFYVAKADAKLFNKASRVVLVRDGHRTVITMVNDFKGDPKEFALVVPVPTVLKREQIHVANVAVVDHLDAYTAPRLVEYYDEDPCQARYPWNSRAMKRGAVKAAPQSAAETSHGVTIEASYTVGEYDILILSAAQSDGLELWLKENGYTVPPGAARVLDSYIKQNLRFFVARVNLVEQSALGFTFLRPLQIAFETPKFMLPIRLGTVNADGAQDLILYTLTRDGRVETVNYRTVKLPTDMDVPLFVENEFDDFYRDMFSEQVRRHGMSVVFTEYAWDMGWCDPCAADPLSPAELRELGVFWVDGRGPGPQPRIFPPQPQAQNVFVTRLHVRYDGAHFPEDLAFQQTGDRTNFQGRYVLRHPWTGSSDCDAAAEYRRQLQKRQQREAEQLAELTGWDLQKIHEKMELVLDESRRSWWEELWDR